VKACFAKALDSQFQRLGQSAVYVSADGSRQSLLVMARRPEQLFSLGDGELHAEHPQLAFRVSEKIKPRRGDCLVVDNVYYNIAAAPRLDLHHLLWLLDCLRQEALLC